MNHTNSRAACKLLIHKHNLTDGPAGHIVEFVMRGGMTIQPSVAQVVFYYGLGLGTHGGRPCSAQRTPAPIPTSLPRSVRPSTFPFATSKWRATPNFRSPCSLSQGMRALSDRSGFFGSDRITGRRRRGAVHVLGALALRVQRDVFCRIFSFKNIA